MARNEAHNLADCLASASWAEDRVVVVDPTSRDATLEIARREADLVTVRDFDDFASLRLISTSKTDLPLAVSLILE